MLRTFSGPTPLCVALLAVWAVSLLAAWPQNQFVAVPPPTPVSGLSPELRGDLAMARQQYADAIQAYSQGPANSAVLWNKLGMAYHHLFAFDQAKRDYLHALRLRPDYPEALNNLGAVYYAKRDYHKAVKYYRRALRLQPGSASIYTNLGTAYFAEKKPDLGIQAYRMAFALNPRVLEGNPVQLVTGSLSTAASAQQDFCIARLFAQSGQNQRALDYLRRALDEGFDNRREILEDRTLASLRATPQFAQLMNEQKLR